MRSLGNRARCTIGTFFAGMAFWFLIVAIAMSGDNEPFLPLGPLLFGLVLCATAVPFFIAEDGS